MTEIVYKLENFDTPLENSRMIFLLGRSASASAALPAQFNDIVNSPKLASRILIASSKSEYPLAFRAAWNAVFYPTTDWQLVLTYCTYIAKPSIIVIEDGVTVPDAFIGRLQMQNLQILQVRQLGMETVPGWADVAFLPQIADVGSADADNAIRTLMTLLKEQGTAEQKREWLREVRTAKAALVWSRIRERHPGVVYWFDPADGAEGSKQLTGRVVRKLVGALLENI